MEDELYEYHVVMDELCRNGYMLYAHNDEEALRKAVSGKTYFDGIQELIGDPDNVKIVSKRLINREKDNEQKEGY